MSSNERASGLIANKGIECLTFGTPNGHKATVSLALPLIETSMPDNWAPIILEELKEAYGKDYTYQSIPIMENIQKEPWFTRLGPNGRIPVIVDHDRGSFPVMEGIAILLYLTRHYDSEKKFTFEDPSSDDFSRMEQWMAWQHGGMGPMQGQANHFYRFAKEKIPYPTQRYVGETERLYGILDNQLKDREYIVGPGKGKYTIADIACFSWVNVAYFAGVDLSTFPHLEKWWERINSRPAVQKGTAIPSKSQGVNEAYKRRLKEEPEFKQKEDELKELGNKAKEQYNYKYSSP